MKQKAIDSAAASAADQPWPRGYVIRIPKKSDQKRAILALLRVPFAYSSTSAGEFVLLEQHVEALRAVNIPFEDVTGADENHG